ncbi:MAG: alpha/beta hydrolase [Pseudomonadota bacterium]|nr:alpha/beta hydrolase [Pseudomonadota bacterium]
MNTSSESTLPPYAKFVATGFGYWWRLVINLLLRLLVKWTWGLRVPVAQMRHGQAGLDRRMAQRVPEDCLADVDCDGVPAQWLSLSGGAERIILYVHGGAFVARSPALHAAMVAQCCAPLAARALMVDYRLAPEHPYPAAADDCHRAYRWLLAQGYRSNQIVVAGDSAGSNLALATLHRIKAAGEPMPACAVLISPFLDFTLSGASVVSNSRRDPVFTLAFAAAIRACYAPPERFLDPAVSPLFGDFHGFPPLLLQVGSTEMLLDDATRVAEKAKAAGVDVELEIWDRMPHVFQALPVLPQAGKALESVVRFIGAHTDSAQAAIPTDAFAKAA